MENWILPRRTAKREARAKRRALAVNIGLGLFLVLGFAYLGHLDAQALAAGILN